MSDGAGGSVSNQSFAFTVTAVNDAPVAIALNNASTDGSTANDTLGGTLSATAVDSGAFTYTLLDDAGGRFKIVGNQVQVADGILLDFEQNACHAVSARVNDGSGGTFDQDVTISIGNVDPETGTGDGRANTIEGGGLVDRLIVMASDDTLEGGGGADRIDGGTGADIMTGGLGDDRFFVDDAGDVVNEVSGVGSGSDTAFATADWALGDGEAVEVLRAEAASGLRAQVACPSGGRAGAAPPSPAGRPGSPHRLS